MQDKKVLLIALFTILTAVAAYAPSFLGGHSSGTGAAGVSDREKTPRLMLDLLEKERPEYKGVKRDIFSFPRPKASVVARPPAPPPVEAAPDLPPPPPPPTELQTFASQASYIGVLSKQAGRTVFINSGSEVLTVRKGDVIGARFTVEDITDSMLVLKDGSTGEEASIPIQVPR